MIKLDGRGARLKKENKKSINEPFKKKSIEKRLKCLALFTCCCFKNDMTCRLFLMQSNLISKRPEKNLIIYFHNKVYVKKGYSETEVQEVKTPKGC